MQRRDEPERAAGWQGGAKNQEQSGLRALVVPGIISLIITFAALNLWAMPQIATTYVSRADDTKNIQNLANDISGLKTQITALTQQIGVAQATAGKVDSLGQQMVALQTTIPKIDNLNSSINSIQSSLKGYVLSGDISNIQKSVDDLKTSMADLQKKVTTYTTPTPSGGGNYPYGSNTPYGASNIGSTSTWSGITASITSLYQSFGTGVPLMTFAVQPATGGAIQSISLTAGGSGYTTGVCSLLGGSGLGAQGSITTSNGTITSVVISVQGAGYIQGNVLSVVGGTGGLVTVQQASALSPNSVSQSFTLQIMNGNSVEASYIQLALGLALTDNTGNPLSTIPAWLVPGTNLQVSSGGFGMLWSYSSTVSPSVMVFTSGGGTTLFGFGSLDLVANTSTTYTIYVNITNNSPTVASTMYVYPIIRVVGATFPPPPAH